MKEVGKNYRAAAATDSSKLPYSCQRNTLFEPKATIITS